MKKHRFVGLDRDVWLPDDVEVMIAIVPSRITNVRSNQIFTGQDCVTIHSTGNWGKQATALHEMRYLHGGADGRAVGYNFAVHVVGGKRLVIQLTPLNEVTWAAGTVDGNRRSWHIEKAVGGVCDFRATNDLAAILAGALCVASGLDPVKRIFQHFVWYGKNCPQLVREQNLWQPMLQTAARHALAVSALGKPAGPITPPADDGWPYEAPDPIRSLIRFENATQADMDSAPQEIEGIQMVFDTYEVIRPTPRLRWMWGESPRTGPDLPVGARVRILGTKLILSESRWYGVTPAPYWTRVHLGDCKRVSDGFGERELADLTTTLQGMVGKEVAAKG